MEFSLAHNLHFCTMLACPRPPFKGTLSYENINKKNNLMEIPPN